MLELEEDGGILEIHHDAGMGIETALGKATYIHDALVGVALLVRNGKFRIQHQAEMRNRSYQQFGTERE